MTTAADVMRRRLRAPLITLVLGGLALVAFAAVLDRGQSANEVQAFAGQATETSETSVTEDTDPKAAVEISTTVTTVAADRDPTSTRRAPDTTAASRAEPSTSAPVATAAPSTITTETTAAPTTAAPTTAAPTTVAPTAAAPTTVAPTTAAPTTAPSGPRCDPNYSGCVPIASDVDCAGGSGNGPEYVQGPINVIGTDIYDLDRDNDGIACE